MHIDSPTRRSLVYSWAVMHLRPPLHWWMSPNLNLHMATSIWLMQDSGTDCCGPAPRVAGWLPSLRSLWDFCLPSLCLLLPGSLRGSPCRQKEKKKRNWVSGRRMWISIWYWVDDGMKTANGSNRGQRTLPSGCGSATFNLWSDDHVSPSFSHRTWPDIHPSSGLVAF